MISAFAIRVGFKTAALLGSCWVTWELSKHFSSLDGAGMAALFFALFGIGIFLMFSIITLISLIEDIRNRAYELEFKDEED